MEELTNVAEDVVTEVTEDVVSKVGFGTAVTGVCALTGLLTIMYGTYRGGKWVVNKVKAGKDAKVEVLNADEAAKVEAKDVEAE